MMVMKVAIMTMTMAAVMGSERSHEEDDDNDEEAERRDEGDPHYSKGAACLLWRWMRGGGRGCGGGGERVAL